MLFAVVASKQKATVPLLQFLVPQSCEHGLLCLDGREVGNGEELGHPNPPPPPSPGPRIGRRSFSRDSGFAVQPESHPKFHAAVDNRLTCSSHITVGQFGPVEASSLLGTSARPHALGSVSRRFSLMVAIVKDVPSVCAPQRPGKSVAGTGTRVGRSAHGRTSRKHNKPVQLNAHSRLCFRPPAIG